MSTITKEFTKEQLIEKLQHRISVASGFPESEKAQMDLELARIALASLEAEAYGYVHKAAYETAGSCGLSNDHEAYRDSSTHIAVYTAPPAPVSVPDEVAAEDCPAFVKYDITDVDEAWACGFNAFRAAMLQGADDNSPVIPDDVRRMDWLVSKTVDVREPMVYGSHSLFWSQTITDEEDDYHATKLREQIDAAMEAEQAAAPKQEKNNEK